MSFWSMMNWVVWALCALFVFLLVSDFVKVEIIRKIRKEEEQKEQ